MKTNIDDKTKAIERKILLRAYLFQFLFGLGFSQLKIRRKRSYLYIVLIAYSWLSFFNIFLCDFGRGPLGSIWFLNELSQFHNFVGFQTISLGWLIGHIVGLIDLVLTQKKHLVWEHVKANESVKTPALSKKSGLSTAGKALKAVAYSQIALIISSITGYISVLGTPSHTMDFIIFFSCVNVACVLIGIISLISAGNSLEKAGKALE